MLRQIFFREIPDYKPHEGQGGCQGNFPERESIMCPGNCPDMLGLTLHVFFLFNNAFVYIFDKLHF
jgi:hypothetical protein